MPATIDDFDWDELEPGQVPVARPFDDPDDAEVRFYGFAEKSASPMYLEIGVENDDGVEIGIFLYKVVDLNEDESKFIVEPDGATHKRAQEAVEACGGEVQHGR